MMTKGMKIRAIKNIEDIIKAGEICEIVDIGERIIKFKFGGVHLGGMTYEEYVEYFEEFKNSSKPVKRTSKKRWSAWKKEIMSYYNMKGNLCFENIEKRSNGERVQIRIKKDEESYIKARSSCHPADKFDYNKGLELAKMRLIAKIHEQEIHEMAVNM